MAYPSIVEVLSSLSACGVAKETTFRTPVLPTAFTPFDSSTLMEDPGTFSPPTMQGVISTDVYPMQGEAKVAGNIAAPLYAINGVPMLLGSIGQDQSAGNGVFGVPRAIATAPGSAGTSTSFAATGVTSITLTGITGTFATGQTLLISGSSDTADAQGRPGWETVRCSNFSTPTVTCTATTKVHTGTITVSSVGWSEVGSVAVGGGSVTVTSGGGSSYAVNDIIQIDVNSGTTTTSELHKIASISTDTLNFTDYTAQYAHSANAQVIRLTTAGLFYHAVSPGTLNSYTIERNIGGVQSLQFAGCKFAKGAIDAPMGNAACKITVDAMGAAAPVAIAPTAASTDTTPPYQFTEGAFSVFGATHSETSNFKINWDNALKESWTYSGSHFASFLTKTDFHVNGTFDAIFSNSSGLTDSTYGFFTKMLNQTQGALSFTLTHASDGSFINVYCPLVVLDKYGVTTTVGNVVIQPITFKAFYSVSAATGPLTIVVANNMYLPY